MILIIDLTIELPCFDLGRNQDLNSLWSPAPEDVTALTLPISPKEQRGMNPLDGEEATRFLAPSVQRLLTQYCARKGLNCEMLSMRRIPGRGTIKRFLLSGRSVAMR
jgi:hypothetical protein